MSAVCERDELTSTVCWIVKVEGFICLSNPIIIKSYSLIIDRSCRKGWWEEKGWLGSYGSILYTKITAVALLVMGQKWV